MICLQRSLTPAGFLQKGAELVQQKNAKGHLLQAILTYTSRESKPDSWPWWDRFSMKPTDDLEGLWGYLPPDKVCMCLVSQMGWSGAAPGPTRGTSRVGRQ